MLKVAQFFKKIFLNRYAIVSIGFLSLLSLIWLALPMLGINTLLIKSLFSAVVVGFGLLVCFLQKVIVKRRGSKLKDQLQNQHKSMAGQILEIEALKEKMNEAIASLKASDLGVKYRGSAALYALPWIIIIGPSASGKSTLLRNSGLHFPFSNQEDLRVKGFGGTRNCDWWFSDEAILIDTAGRYTTDESDHDEWFAFLSLLKRNRPKLPLNGIIVTMSLVDLLVSDDSAVELHVNIIRKRIAELYRQLGYVFPIYIIFTKVDLLKGFEAFFGGLSSEERKQVWGINIQDVPREEDKAQHFEMRLQELYALLTHHRMNRLALADEQIEKFEIYDFPEQFSAGIKRIARFVDLLVKHNPYQETPDIQGVYFGNGTQEGKAIKRVLGESESLFVYDDYESPNANENSKSYFIRDLLCKVIFKNQVELQSSKRKYLSLRFIKWLSVCFAIGVFIMAIAYFSFTFTANAILIRHAKSDAIKILSHETDTSIIDRTFSFYLKLTHKTMPWYLRGGLYQGDEFIPVYQRILDYALRESLLSLLTQKIEHQLKKYHNIWSNKKSQRESIRGAYYEALRNYLLFCLPKRLSLESKHQYLMKLIYDSSWSNSENIKAIVHYMLLQMHGEYIEPPKPNYRLIQQARKQLYSTNEAENLYAMLLNQASKLLGKVSIDKLINGYGTEQLISQSQLPLVYTNEAWKNFVYPEINKLVQQAQHGDWVVDMPIQTLARMNLGSSDIAIVSSDMKKDKLKQSLYEMYFEHYANAWFKFLNSLSLKRFTSLQDAAKQLHVLQDSTGPMTQLFNLICKNIDLRMPTSHRLIDNDSSQTYAQELKFQFSGIQSMLHTEKMSCNAQSLNSYLKQLTKLQMAIEQLASDPNIQEQSRIKASAVLSGNDEQSQFIQNDELVNQLVSPIENLSALQAMKHVLLMPLKSTWRVVLQNAGQALQHDWQHQVLNDYQQTIFGNFPFSDNANDAYPQAVSTFLHPQTGLFWRFVNNKLTPFFSWDGEQWQAQTWLGIGLNLSAKFKHKLKITKDIAQNLFMKNSDTPEFDFQVYPIPSLGVESIILTSNNQSFKYYNGPQIWHTLHWPGSSDTPIASIMIENTQGQMKTISFNGPWGLFRLLAKAYSIRFEGTVLIATWKFNIDHHNYYVSLKFKTGPINLFRELLTGTFKLPYWILQDEVV